MRRAHDFLTPVGSQPCPNCGALAKPHHMCISCGYYKGREVVTAQA
jgi:large subunit ribosomal protein L32